MMSPYARGAVLWLPLPDSSSELIGGEKEKLTVICGNSKKMVTKKL
jgi:hypothetical protein